MPRTKKTTKVAQKSKISGTTYVGNEIIKLKINELKKAWTTGFVDALK